MIGSHITTPAVFYGISTDAANTYTATIPGAALVPGYLFMIKFSHHMTGACTLNINGAGAKAMVLPSGNGVVDAQGVDGQTCLLVYDGTQFNFVVTPNNA